MATNGLLPNQGRVGRSRIIRRLPSPPRTTTLTRDQEQTRQSRRAAPARSMRARKLLVAASFSLGPTNCKVTPAPYSLQMPAAVSCSVFVGFPSPPMPRPASSKKKRFLSHGVYKATAASRFCPPLAPVGRPLKARRLPFCVGRESANTIGGLGERKRPPSPYEARERRSARREGARISSGHHRLPSRPLVVSAKSRPLEADSRQDLGKTKNRPVRLTK
jgi:hypothetical protein